MGYIILVLGIAIAIAISGGNKKKKKENKEDPINTPPKTDEERLKDLNRKIFASRFGFTPIGETGENIIEYDLINLPFYKKIIRNAYIPYNGGTSEIDLILLTEFGIYVIKRKN